MVPSLICAVLAVQTSTPPADNCDAANGSLLEIIIHHRTHASP
jgi:hypothetical protein